jgi:hypothetical protein
LERVNSNVTPCRRDQLQLVQVISLKTHDVRSNLQRVQVNTPISNVLLSIGTIHCRFCRLFIELGPNILKYLQFLHLGVSEGIWVRLDNRKCMHHSIFRHKMNN